LRIKSCDTVMNEVGMTKGQFWEAVGILKTLNAVVLFKGDEQIFPTEEEDV